MPTRWHHLHSGCDLLATLRRVWWLVKYVGLLSLLVWEMTLLPTSVFMQLDTRPQPGCWFTMKTRVENKNNHHNHQSQFWSSELPKNFWAMTNQVEESLIQFLFFSFFFSFGEKNQTKFMKPKWGRGHPLVRFLCLKTTYITRLQIDTRIKSSQPLYLSVWFLVEEF